MVRRQPDGPEGTCDGPEGACDGPEATCDGPEATCVGPEATLMVRRQQHFFFVLPDGPRATFVV